MWYPEVRLNWTSMRGLRLERQESCAVELGRCSIWKILEEGAGSTNSGVTARAESPMDRKHSEIHSMGSQSDMTGNWPFIFYKISSSLMCLAKWPLKQWRTRLLPEFSLFSLLASDEAHKKIALCQKYSFRSPLLQKRKSHRTMLRLWTLVYFHL